TTTAATSTTALADSVLMNARSGAAPRRVQSVRSPVSTTGGQYVSAQASAGRPGPGLGSPSTGGARYARAWRRIVVVEVDDLAEAVVAVHPQEIGDGRPRR